MPPSRGACHRGRADGRAQPSSSRRRYWPCPSTFSASSPGRSLQREAAPVAHGLESARIWGCRPPPRAGRRTPTATWSARGRPGSPATGRPLRYGSAPGRVPAFHPMPGVLQSARAPIGERRKMAPMATRVQVAQQAPGCASRSRPPCPRGSRRGCGSRTAAPLPPGGVPGPGRGELGQIGPAAGRVAGAPTRIIGGRSGSMARPRGTASRGSRPARAGPRRQGRDPHPAAAAADGCGRPFGQVSPD